MAALIAFFEGIGNAIISGFDFVISFFQDLIYTVQLIGKTLLAIPGYFSWLPSSFQVLLIALIGVVAVYKILGREG